MTTDQLITFAASLLLLLGLLALLRRTLRPAAYYRVQADAVGFPAALWYWFVALFARGEM